MVEDARGALICTMLACVVNIEYANSTHIFLIYVQKNLIEKQIW